MGVINFRAGFASNSSSMHSTFLCEKSDVLEEMLPPYLSRWKDGRINCLSDYGFQWEDFILTKKDSINIYLAAQIVNNIQQNIGKETANFFLPTLFETLFPKMKSAVKDKLIKSEYLIDHQSVWGLPFSFNDTHKIVPDVEFLKDLIAYANDNDVIITGGNDNDTCEERKEVYGHLKGKETPINRLPRDGSPYEKIFSWKDGDVWVLFNSTNGNKTRLSFKGDIEYRKSSKPELVDLIISNQCSHNCNFCYRDCIPDGKVASIKSARDYMDALINLGVPEIVIGGGDILEYPYLEQLCEQIEHSRPYYNGVFNTTINIGAESYIHSPLKSRIDLILKTFNGVAVSNSRGLFYDNSLWCLANFGKAAITVQCIPELMSQYEIERVVEECSKPTKVKGLTFLGLKNCGRASTIKISPWDKDAMDKTRNSFDAWFKNASEHWLALGVDTQFIKNFPKVTEMCDNLTYTTEEGKFSCCIDATDNSIAPSSYSPSETKVYLKNAGKYRLPEEIKEEFAKF